MLINFDRYYVTSYNFLRDSYKLKSELEEVKTVADYLNYKVSLDIQKFLDLVTVVFTMLY